MKYVKWATEKEIQDELVKSDINNQTGEGGLPLIWKQNTPYLDTKCTHTLLIGGSGSGKTQSIILPYLKISMIKGENLIINDKQGELYEKTAQKLKELGYKTYVYNFQSPRLSLGFNPLALAFQLYQEKRYDEGYKILEIVATSIFKEEAGTDPFWNNAAISLFKGLALYLFAFAASSEINLNSLYFLADELENEKKCQEFIASLSKESQIYILLQMILKAPYDTRASIISVFTSKLKEYISRSDLAKMLATSDFSLIDILSSKFAIFINGSDDECQETLTSILISQLYEARKLLKEVGRINVILDDFDELAPIKDFAKILNSSRSLSIRFLIVIKGYTNLLNTYGHYFEIIKMCFDNLIYLRSNDVKTMEEISRTIGEMAYHEPLVSPLELKQLKIFEAIILLPRMLPFKKTLTPDYKINWGYEIPKATLKERTLPDIKIYKLNFKD